MTKDVLIKISGMQFAGEGTPEPVEIITTGTYYLKNGKHYIIYDEVMEGFTETTRNTIKVGEKSVDILKKGISNVHMMFEENRKNVAYYYTPYGSLLLGLDAGRVEITEEEDALKVQVHYVLEMNYEKVADCTIKMDICSRNCSQFRIKEERPTY